MRVLVTGGGTGGHINPALAAANYLKDKHGAEILFVGTEKGLEKKLVPKDGFPIRFIEVEGLLRKLSVQNLKIAAKYLKAISASKKIIREFKPDVVIGTGGYVCAPVLSAAHALHIPTVIHEQNVIPGVTVKMAARYVDCIAISFQDTLKYLPQKLHKKCVLTGNPIRENMMMLSYESARRKLNLDSRPFLFMFGGSLGAQKLNETMTAFLNQADTSQFQFCAGTGERYYEETMAKIDRSKLGQNVKILPYIFNMDVVMRAADVVVARAGALTISELCALGKPSILIPSPNVAHNHQEYNARSLEKEGAAVVLTEKELTPERFCDAVETLLKNRIDRQKMANCAEKIGITDGTKRICEIALSLASGQ